jgi:hypothetical protein
MRIAVIDSSILVLIKLMGSTSTRLIFEQSQSNRIDIHHAGVRLSMPQWK